MRIFIPVTDGSTSIVRIMTPCIIKLFHDVRCDMQLADLEPYKIPRAHIAQFIR